MLNIRCLLLIVIVVFINCSQESAVNKTSQQIDEDVRLELPKKGYQAIILDKANLDYIDEVDSNWPLYSIVTIEDVDTVEDSAIIMYKNHSAIVPVSDLLFSETYEGLHSLVSVDNRIRKAYVDTVKYHISLLNNNLKTRYIIEKQWFLDQNSESYSMLAINFDKKNKMWLADKHRFVDGEYKIVDNQLIITIPEQDFYSIFNKPGQYNFLIHLNNNPNPAHFSLYSKELDISLYYSQEIQLPDGLYHFRNNSYLGYLGEYELNTKVQIFEEPGHSENSIAIVPPHTITLIGKSPEFADWYLGWVSIEEGYTDLVWIYLPLLEDSLFKIR